MTSTTRNKIAATLVAAFALGAAAPAASAEEQQAMSPEQVYAYTCGHLGTDCAAEDDKATTRKRTKRAKRSKRACTTAKRRAAKRAGRKALRKHDRRCGSRKTRRAGARR